MKNSLVAQKILFIKLGAIGDVVMSLPLVAKLRSLNPNCEITWVCGKSVAGIVKNIPEVSRVVVVDDQKILNGSLFSKLSEIFKSWAGLGFRSFDLTLVGHSNRGYRLFTLLSLSRQRRSFGTSPGNHALPSPARSHSAEYIRLATGIDGSELPSPTPYQLFDHKPISKKIGIAPGGAKNLKRDTPHRRWPLESYVMLAKSLVGRGYNISIFGGPSDDWVLAAFDGIPYENLVGKMNLLETTREMSRHELIVTHDSGPAHLASLSPVPLITLFGPTSPRNFAPLGVKKRFMTTKHWLACQPCYDGLECAPCNNFLCMSTISVDDVLLACEEFL